MPKFPEVNGIGIFDAMHIYTFCTNYLNSFRQF